MENDNTSVVTTTQPNLVLRTIISVNHRSIYRAVADMCDKLACRISGCSESTGKLVAQKNSETMVMPTEMSTTNKTPQTNETVQGDLLREYERKIANLPDYLQLIQLCYNVGITVTVATGQYFTTLDDAELDKLGGSCRERTFTWRQRSIQSKRMDPWKREDRFSFGGGRQSPSRPLRNREHDQLLIWRWNLYLGNDR